MQELTRELVGIVAAANGLEIPEERLDLVLREYESFMRTITELNQLPLSREAEPAILYSLALPSLTPRDGER